MEINTAPPATPTPAMLSTSTPAQIPTAQTVPTSPTVPAHATQVAPAAKTLAPAPPTLCTTATQTATPAPATTPTVVNPVRGVTADTTVEHSAPTPGPVDSEAEAKLSAEIVELWGVQKNGKATVRRTRTELKALRLALAEKLHAMKAILVRTGRGGGWASYLRSQKLPLPTADRYVAEHQATLAPPAKKVISEELSTPTVDEIRQLAQKILPKLCRVLTTQELVFEFIHELVWNIDVAEAWETEKGFELPKVESEDVPEVDAHVAGSANLAPAVP
jgi:hypothetical protein